MSDLTDFEAQFDPHPGDSLSDWLRALGETKDEDELFNLLPLQRPPQSKLARQQVRGRLVKILAQQFRAFGSAASPAKTADAWLSEGDEVGDALQGREYVAESTDPWEEPVDAADVLDEVAATFDAYLYSTRENLTVLALWSAYSHCFDAFGVSPILDISSPTKRCGKSTAVVVLRHLCAQPLLSGNITTSALFRSVEAWKPTLLIDEADTFLKMADELRGVLNAGHTRDTAFTIRSEGDANEPRMFSTWAPKVVAAIGRLPDTIEDRSIRVLLARKPTTVHKADAFDPFAVREACTPARRRLVRFVLDNLDEIAANKVARPERLNDRAWNNWRPLFMIAKAVGADWPQRCLEAALALAAREDADDEDVGTLLLRHVWEAMGSPEDLGAKITTADLIDLLVVHDDAPWAKWWAADSAEGTKRKRVASAIAHRLKPFGVKPRQLWTEDGNARGYEYDGAFALACTTYLDLDARNARDARTGTSKQAIPSDPSDPSDLYEGPRARPLLGEEMFPVLLANAGRDGHITEREFEERYALHKFVEGSQTT